MNQRSVEKEIRLAAAMRLQQHQVRPVLQQLAKVLSYRDLAAWLETLGEPTSIGHLHSIVDSAPRRRRDRGGQPDGSGPIPPVPGRRAA